jgi:hypothetical protein
MQVEGATTTNSLASPGSVAAFNTASAVSFATTANINRFIHIYGIIVTGANTGNITAQIKSQGGGTETVYIGSRMTVTLLA